MKLTRLVTALALSTALIGSAFGAGLNLNWTDGSTAETAVIVERSTDGETFTQLASVPANTVSYLDESVAEGTRYYYRVKNIKVTANETVESGYSNVANGVLPLGAPADLTVDISTE